MNTWKVQMTLTDPEYTDNSKDLLHTCWGAEKQRVLPKFTYNVDATS